MFGVFISRQFSNKKRMSIRWQVPTSQGKLVQMISQPSTFAESKQAATDASQRSYVGNDAPYLPHCRLPRRVFVLPTLLPARTADASARSSCTQLALDQQQPRNICQCEESATEERGH
jgi:hypothetical protein